MSKSKSSIAVLFRKYKRKFLPLGKESQLANLEIRINKIEEMIYHDRDRFEHFRDHIHGDLEDQWDQIKRIS